MTPREVAVRGFVAARKCLYVKIFIRANIGVYMGIKSNIIVKVTFFFMEAVNIYPKHRPRYNRVIQDQTS